MEKIVNNVFSTSPQVSNFRVLEYANIYSTNEHVPQENELLYVLDGKMTLHLEEHLVFQAMPGDFLIVESGISHRDEFAALKGLRIMLLHIMPSCSHYLIIRFCTGISGTILSAATLAYLSVGLDPTIPNWGAIIADGQSVFMIHPYMILWPGVWMIISVFGFIFFGEGLRERLDPRLK